MMVTRWLAALVFCVLALAGAACDDDGTSVGNDLICGDGDNCENTCSAAEEVCDTECKGGSECKATCAAGKDCDFICRANATCTFDCSKQSCQTVGEAGSSCTCTGECIGTCGGGGGGGGGDTCVDACGSPTDPGYAACVQACS